MKIPHNALVALANGEKFVVMRNTGGAFEPRLDDERIGEASENDKGDHGKQKCPSGRKNEFVANVGYGLEAN